MKIPKVQSQAVNGRIDNAMAPPKGQTMIIYIQVRVQSDLAQKHIIYLHIIGPVFKYIL